MSSPYPPLTQYHLHAEEIHDMGFFAQGIRLHKLIIAFDSLATDYAKLKRKYTPKSASRETVRDIKQWVYTWLMSCHRPTSTLSRSTHNLQLLRNDAIWLEQHSSKYASLMRAAVEAHSTLIAEYCRLMTEHKLTHHDGDLQRYLDSLIEIELPRDNFVQHKNREEIATSALTLHSSSKALLIALDKLPPDQLTPEIRLLMQNTHAAIHEAEK